VRKGLADQLVDPFSRLAALQEHLKGDNTKLPPMLGPVGSVAVAADGCCAAVLIGPLLRLYSLDDHRLIAEQIFSDVLPAPVMFFAQPTSSLLLSRDGKAYVISLDTWVTFRAAMGADGQQRQLKRELRVYARDAAAPTAVLDQRYVPTPATAFPLDWPLAVDSRGRQIALQRITEKGVPSKSVVVLRFPGNAEVLQTERRPWTFDPFDSGTFAVPATVFSADDAEIATASSQPDCPFVVETNQAWMPSKVPICSRLSTTVDVWALANRRPVSQTVFTTTLEKAKAASPAEKKPVGPLLGLPPRPVLGMDLSDGTLVQTILDGDPIGDPQAVALTTLRVRLQDQDQSLTKDACRRLPSDARTVPIEEWRRDLPGEPYRTICP
jgi:hypothetical protein